MFKLNGKSVLFIVIGILLLLPTPSVSQIVQIDSIREVTTLDKKATIAIGNQLKEGTNYRELFKEQSVLVDSLFKENALRKEQIYELRDIAIPTLKDIVRELELQNTSLAEKMDLKDQLNEMKLKRKRGNFWKGLGIGALMGGAAILVLNN